MSWAAVQDDSCAAPSACSVPQVVMLSAACAGKTTLLQILAGQYMVQPDAGQGPGAAGLSRHCADVVGAAELTWGSSGGATSPSQATTCPWQARMSLRQFQDLLHAASVLPPQSWPAWTIQKGTRWKCMHWAQNHCLLSCTCESTWDTYGSMLQRTGGQLAWETGCMRCRAMSRPAGCRPVWLVKNHWRCFCVHAEQ